MTKNTITSSNRNFPLFQSHLDLAHQYWIRLLQKGDLVVDATAGNGHDSLYLAQQILTPSDGYLYVMDIQAKAIEQTKERIEAAIPECAHRVHYLEQSHEEFPENFSELKIKLFSYNLGYLPGANKEITTLTESTLLSLQKACKLVCDGGVISITCYPGHPEGALEEEALIKWCTTLNKEMWNICHHRWINRSRSPSLLLLQKNSILASHCPKKGP